MFGFIYATVSLSLPHILIRSIVVSTTETNNREGWPYIDNLSNEEICNPPPDAPLPVGLHYCKRYALDKWFFSKYRLKKKYISCESPLLQPPPDDLGTRNYTKVYQPPPHGHPQDKPWEAPVSMIKSRQAKREGFMLCALINKINEAARYWKDHACSKDGNANYDYYNIFDDPNH
jgi:hypothetical protein